MDFTQGKVFVQIVLHTEEEGVSESEIGPKIFSKSVACVAGAKRGGGGGGREKGKREESPPPLPNPLPFFPSSLSPILYPFRRLLRRLQNPQIRWSIHLPPYGRFECKHSKKESQLGRGKPVWYILEKHV